MAEADPNVFAFILLVESKTPLQLNFQELLTADVVCDEICTLPIIAQSDCRKPEICKYT
ncbi:MAG: hypothetical protein RLZZ352_958 [Pseudomonadota bacterium]